MGKQIKPVFDCQDVACGFHTRCLMYTKLHFVEKIFTLCYSSTLHFKKLSLMVFGGDLMEANQQEGNIFYCRKIKVYDDIKGLKQNANLAQ